MEIADRWSNLVVSYYHYGTCLDQMLGVGTPSWRRSRISAMLPDNVSSYEYINFVAKQSWWYKMLDDSWTFLNNLRVTVYANKGRPRSTGIDHVVNSILKAHRVLQVFTVRRHGTGFVCHARLYRLSIIGLPSPRVQCRRAAIHSQLTNRMSFITVDLLYDCMQSLKLRKTPGVDM